MEPSTLSIFLLGFGNYWRSDDGLGPRLAEDLKEAYCRDVSVESASQLQPEHVEAIVRHDIAILADADISANRPFYFSRLNPASRHVFSSHALSPGSLLYIAREVLGVAPDCFLLGIRGYDFKIGRGLTNRAKRNLDSAKRFIKGFIDNYLFVKLKLPGIGPDGSAIC